MALPATIVRGMHFDNPESISKKFSYIEVAMQGRSHGDFPKRFRGMPKEPSPCQPQLYALSQHQLLDAGGNWPLDDASIQLAFQQKPSKAEIAIFK